ncbi:MAG: ThiF family adenylyltransferase [Clostridia bacterium]|nr:ThiF family adenylyltransferase [Clostridia bacterium]
MQHELINLNPDLKKLQDEGYELEIKEGYAMVSHIPYLNESGLTKYGILVSTLNVSGDKVLKPDTHVINFSGDYPCDLNGKKIKSIEHQSINAVYGDVNCNFSFSNKPSGGYNDYYEKFIRYIEVISAPALSKNNGITAKTFKKVVVTLNNNFVYEDTNASRSGIGSINNKLKNQKIGIIGLGGTGSYILDFIAKNPVSEIHLFDGDCFYQHNAFRAPGAPKKTKLSKGSKKTTYFKSIYRNMHKGIISHPFFISAASAKKWLKNLDFVFICIDNGKTREMLVNILNLYNIKFIDTGIDIIKSDKGLLGSIRNTCVVDGGNSKVIDRISYADDKNDEYKSNIQVAELNALAAIYAIIKWKKINGFYLENNEKFNLIYDTNDGELKYED